MGGRRGEKEGSKEGRKGGRGKKKKKFAYLTTLGTAVFPTYDGFDVRFIGCRVQASSLEGEHAIDRLR